MIWKPLAMVDTGFVVPADKAGATPAASRIFRRRWCRPSSSAAAVVRWAPRATICVSPSMLLDGGKLGDTRLLGRKTVES